MMNKNMFVLLFVCLLICIGLSGCTQTGDVTGDTDKFEIVSYKVESWNNSHYYNIEGSKIGDGFIHNDAVNTYKVYGVIKNKCGHKANIRTTINFCDSNDNLLDSYGFNISGLPNTYEETFTHYFGEYHGGKNRLEYWSDIDKVNFKLEEI